MHIGLLVQLRDTCKVMCACTMGGERIEYRERRKSGKGRDEKRRRLQRKRREMKGEGRDDKEEERKGDIPLGGSHR